MPERFKSKDKKPQKSIKTVTLKKKECCIRIEIQGKSFEQIRERLERGVTPKRKSPIEKALFELYKGKEHFIKLFIQEKLHSFYEDYMKERGIAIKHYPIILNYSERKACVEIFFNIAIDPSLEPIFEDLVKLFMAYLIKEFADRINKNGGRQGSGAVTISNITNITNSNITNSQVNTSVSTDKKGSKANVSNDEISENE